MSKTLFREAVLDREHRDAYAAGQESAAMDEELRKQSALLQRTNEDVNALNMQFRRLDHQLASWTRNPAREPKAGGGALMRLLALVGAFLLGAILGPGILKAQFPTAQQQALTVDPEEPVPWQTPMKDPAQAKVSEDAPAEEPAQAAASKQPDEPKPAILPDGASEAKAASENGSNAAPSTEPVKAEKPKQAPQDSPQQAAVTRSAPLPIEDDEPLAPELFVGIGKKAANPEPARVQQAPRGQQVQSVNGRIGI